MARRKKEFTEQVVDSVEAEEPASPLNKGSRDGVIRYTALQVDDHEGGTPNVDTVTLRSIKAKRR